jgi:hypothetical protein
LIDQPEKEEFMRPPRIFWVVVKDDSRHIFNLHGPLTDDRAWGKGCCDAQDAGHTIRIETPDGTLSRDEVIDQMRQIGYRLSETVILTLSGTVA